VLDFPFRGTWRVENSPAHRVPSHGTYAFGTSHAIDFVAVNDRGRSAPRTWRSLVAAEPPEIFRGFGQPILAPLSGTVVLTHDGEPDHEARRSQLTLVPYMLGQAERVRAGIPAIAGNYVVIAVRPGGPFVLLAHLRRGTVQVRPGQRLQAGEPLAKCGNSGNSTEPHVHVQVSDSTDWITPTAFRSPSGGPGPPPGCPPSPRSSTPLEHAANDSHRSTRASIRGRFRRSDEQAAMAGA